MSGIKSIILIFILVCVGHYELKANVLVKEGKISLELPGNWDKQSGPTVRYYSKDHQGAVVLIVNPVQTNKQPEVFLKDGVQAMEKNFKILKVFPGRPKLAKTKSNVDYVFWGIKSSRSGSNRYSSYFLFYDGNEVQAMILMCNSAKSYSDLMKELGTEVDKIAFESDATQNTTQSNNSDSFDIKAQVGNVFQYFNYRMNVPKSWKFIKGRIGGESMFETTGGQEGFQTLRSGDEINIVALLEPVQIINAEKVLINTLTKRTNLVRHANRVGDWKKNFYRQDKVKGGTMTTISYWTRPEDQFMMGGVVLQADGYALSLGSGIKIYKYDLLSHPDRVNHDVKQFIKYLNELANVCASLDWTGVGETDLAKSKWLMAKKKLHYQNTRNASSTNLSILFSKEARWDFFTNQTASYHIEKLSSFMDNATTSSGTPDYSSGHSSTNASGNRADFEIKKKANRHYLLMRYANGSGSVHDISFSPFMIDGLRDGCCK